MLPFFRDIYKKTYLKIHSGFFEETGITQGLKMLLCFRLHPNHVLVFTAQPSLITTEEKTQNKILEHL